MGTLALRITGGAKRYQRDGRELPIFEAIDLEVEQGEVFALLGPSGCGKSTLLRAVTGLEPLSAGRIELGQGALAETGRPIGIVFQEPLLLPWLTVLLVTHDVEEALYVGDRVALMGSRPSTITRVWDAGHGDERRQRDDARLRAIRRDILAEYQTDVPAGPAGEALSWVI